MFSVSAAAHAGYKMKSHKGAKKRWSSLGSGAAFKRVCFLVLSQNSTNLPISLLGKSWSPTFECNQSTSTKK
jgi:hypothetical protein